MGENGRSERAQNRTDATFSGRSMVEMLGVLAIIGVLSVGAMSGYSKAMMKYKLNKYAESVNLFINNFIIFRKSLGYTSGGWTNYADILQKLNFIPDGWRYQNFLYLNDNFGNHVRPYHDGKSPSNHDGIIFVFDGSQYSSEICQILVQTAKANSAFIWQLYFQDSKVHYLTYGDNYCTNSARCLRDLSIDNIYNLCYAYMGKDSANIHQIQIVFKADEYI